ncbi:MAG: signal peptidase I [Treponema sp.]|nr:signal peptidase I [Treponema sp.]
MIDKSRTALSYASQKREKHRLLRVIISLIILFVLYNIVTAFFFSVWVLRNDTMQPGLRPGDRFLVASTALPNMFAGLRPSDSTVPAKRGNLVIIDTRQGEKKSLFLSAIDIVIRFFTIQQFSLFNAEEHLFIKRLVALPGDEIYMNNYILRIRPAGNSFPLTEFEFADRPYYPNIPQGQALWDESLPLSGNMERIILGPGEFFVISDDRGSTGDSRTWGPIGTKEIVGRPILRIWPPARIGIP